MPLSQPDGGRSGRQDSCPCSFKTSNLIHLMWSARKVRAKRQNKCGSGPLSFPGETPSALRGAVLHSGELQSSPEHIELHTRWSWASCLNCFQSGRGAGEPRAWQLVTQKGFEGAITMGPSFRAGATGMGQGIQVVSSHSHSSSGVWQPCPHPGRSRPGGSGKMRRNQTTLGPLWAETTLVSSVPLVISCLFLKSEQWWEGRNLTV